MKLDHYLEIKKQLREYADNVEESKRPSYTSGSDNVLENFIRDGKLQGLPPMQNWLSHFLKQVAAIVSFVRNPDVTPSEPLISRMADLQTYATLGLAVAFEENRLGTGLSGDTAETLAKYIKMADDAVDASGVFEKGYVNPVKYNPVWTAKWADELKRVNKDSDYGH